MDENAAANRLSLLPPTSRPPSAALLEGVDKRYAERSLGNEDPPPPPNGAVRGTTMPDQPHGCLGVQSALVTSDGAIQIRKLLIERRRRIDVKLNERFQQAAEEGDLAAETDPGVLARYLSMLMSGIAVQAAGGVSREELQAMTDAVLEAWPPF